MVSFLTGFLLLLGGSVLANPAMSKVGKWMALGGGAIGLVLTQGREHKNIIRRLGSGI